MRHEVLLAEGVSGGYDAVSFNTLQRRAEGLPPEAPLAMPLQDWNACAATPLRSETAPQGIALRRFLLIAGALLIALTGGFEMLRAAAPGGFALDELLLVALFVPLFAWIGFGFLTALAGFVRLLAGARDFALVADTVPVGRTAILVPVYNEDVSAVFARIRTMALSLAREGRARDFDIFVLSDSSVANGCAEYAAFLSLRPTLAPRLYYRRREANIERKPGNIADWVHRFGGAYDYMLVLDADSLMDGCTMARMAATLDANPGVGLIQTVPDVINARTLFARWQQFSGRLYGPVATAGMIWWSGSEATFWGHNAIIRTRAFAESCGLAALPGRAPFGGAIMSHDMVEAALLRRRGWAVHMVAAPGSTEEFPPSIVDFAKRDRRWCQGNLQHLRILRSAGFHWVNRLQLLMGGSAYFTSPLWLLLIVAGVVHHVTQGAAAAPAPWLLGVTLALLFGPKLLGLVWTLIDRRRRTALGGVRRIAASVVVDVPLSALVAPLMMLTQTLNLADILMGRSSGWSPQRRETDGIALADALRQYRPHVVIGTAMLAVAAAGIGSSLWVLPVAVGLVLSPWIEMLTARQSAFTALFRVADRPVLAASANAPVPLRAPPSALAA
ncbi:glucans biosynthesis glucosyltransferase MdoH [Sphingosinicella sp.]|uniref:glucans biosynthesis glucosyltransferase MdoH n=1 Tax=Sphingosinicella sp. TaxID=1917971 RepID=UPI001846FA4C|nr:glucans biosynthesis glucosyltransferase MdoH [Sphingosinicella sp.]MBA4757975.1 glucans biosynthesis glucosyltransferase MdoH [Sphingosinicella sp.]